VQATKDAKSGADKRSALPLAAVRADLSVPTTPPRLSGPHMLHIQHHRPLSPLGSTLSPAYLCLVSQAAAWTEWMPPHSGPFLGRGDPPGLLQGRCSLKKDQAQHGGLRALNRKWEEPDVLTVSMETCQPGNLHRQQASKLLSSPSFSLNANTISKFARHPGDQGCPPGHLGPGKPETAAWGLLMSFEDHWHRVWLTSAQLHLLLLKPAATSSGYGTKAPQVCPGREKKQQAWPGLKEKHQVETDDSGMSWPFVCLFSKSWRLTRSDGDVLDLSFLSRADTQHTDKRVRWFQPRKQAQIMGWRVMMMGVLCHTGHAEKQFQAGDMQKET
jgi:hypothetical protein